MLFCLHFPGEITHQMHYSRRRAMRKFCDVSHLCRNNQLGLISARATSTNTHVIATKRKTNATFYRPRKLRRTPEYELFTWRYRDDDDDDAKTDMWYGITYMSIGLINIDTLSVRCFQLFSREGKFNTTDSRRARVMLILEISNALPPKSRKGLRYIMEKFPYLARIVVYWPIRYCKWIKDIGIYY